MSPMGIEPIYSVLQTGTFATMLWARATYYSIIYFSISTNTITDIMIFIIYVYNTFGVKYVLLLCDT